ncbi:glycoside hydrolase [Asanoa sp. NPDC050611]|uniref:glycoside hydrolase n=1 Tax=Asanoa sp. NPDC050611 TaxID=3157098 RepID=UPI0033E61200
MRRRTTWTIRAATAVTASASLLAASAGSGVAHSQPARPTVVVNWNDERQAVDGFGGSFAFHKAGAIQRLGEPLTSQVLDMIFDDETGIGLDIVRVMVGDGGTWGDQLYDGPTQTIEPEPGVFVWDQPDWPARKASFDAHQVWLMREAKKRGVRTFLASVWSPPAWMKQNNSVVSAGPDGPPNKIRPDMFQAYADYLAEYVLGYEREFGIRITHVSPTNEPEVTTGYSSSQWTPEELRVLVRDHLGPTFARRGVQAKIVLGEGVAFDERFAQPAVLDPAADAYVDVVAAHGYAGLIDDATRAAPGAFAASQERGKTIWQTEYMNQGAPRDRLFVNNTISDGLRYANLIGNLFAETGLNAYFWWWPAANNGADGSDLIRLVNTGTPQSGNPTENGQYRIFKRYYTIGQYSRFLDPGDRMIGATRTPVPGVSVTAYKGKRDFSIVVVNNNTTDVTLDVALAGGFPKTREVGAYRTSASENMRRLRDVRTHDRSFTATLRAQSVTTFASTDLPALPDRKDVFSTYPAAENDGHSPGLRIRDNIATGVRDGSWLRWSNVNFADGSAAGFADQKGELRLHTTVAPRAGGVIEARVDSPHGPLVATMTVPAGNGTTWQTATSWVDTSPGAANGFHDLYLVFRGGRGQLFDVDQTAFSD